MATVEELLAQGYTIAEPASVPSAQSDPVAGLLAQGYTIGDPQQGASVSWDSPAPSNRTWGDTFTDYGKALSRGINSVIDMGAMAFPGPMQSQRIAELTGYSPVEVSPQAQGQQLREALVGNPEYKGAGKLERYIGSGLEASPSAIIGGGLGSAISAGIGGEASKDLGINPIIGSLLGGLGYTTTANSIKGAFSKAPQVADDMIARSMGARPSDFTKSARQKGVFVGDDETNTYLKQSFKQAEKEGILKGAKSEQDIFNNAVKKGRQLSGQLDELLTYADDARGGVRVFPKYRNAQKYIEEAVPVDEKAAAFKQLQEYDDALRAQSDGSVRFLQNEKQILQAKAYPEGSKVREGLDRALSQDLRQTIEDVTDAVLPTDMAGAVKQTNQRLGALLDIKPILAREIAKREGTTALDRAINFIRTTGGYGTAMLGGSYIGGPVGMALGAAGAGAHKFATSPTGQRLLAGGLRMGSNIADVIPTGSSATSALAATAAPYAEAERSLFQQLPTEARQLINTNQLLQTKNDQGGQRPINQQIQQPIPKQALPYNNDQPIPRSSQSISQDTKVTKENVASYVSQQPPIVQAIIKVESAGNPNAKSKAGAQGLMQLMPATAKAHGVKNPLDPEQNVRGGIAAFMEELQRYGDVRLALAAYNAGSPRVDAAIKRANTRNWSVLAKYLPEETRLYPGKVLAEYQKLNGGIA